MSRKHRAGGGFGFMGFGCHICKDSFLVIRQGFGTMDDPNRMLVYCDLRPCPDLQLLRTTEGMAAHVVILDLARLRSLGRGDGLNEMQAAHSWIARESLCARPVPLRRTPGEVEITVAEVEPGEERFMLLQVVFMSDSSPQSWYAVGDGVVTRKLSSVHASLREALGGGSVAGLKKSLAFVVRQEKEMAEYLKDLKSLKREAQEALQASAPPSSPPKRLAPAWTFWFISSEAFLELEEREGGVPRHQDLLARHILVQKEVALDDSLRGMYAGDMAVFSHRWFHPEHPDRLNIKLRRAKGFLREHPCIKWLWCDWLCMPQNHGGPARTESEQRYFEETLHNTNTLYLGLTVVVFFEAQYFGRFWPLLECWSSFQRPSLDGLTPSLGAAACRAHFCCVASSEGMESQVEMLMRDLWGALSVDQLREKLMSEDIHVTNQKDKKLQAEVLFALDRQVAEAFRHLCADSDGGFASPEERKRFAAEQACLDRRVLDLLPRHLKVDPQVVEAADTGVAPPRPRPADACTCSLHRTAGAEGPGRPWAVGDPVLARRHFRGGRSGSGFCTGEVFCLNEGGTVGVRYEDGDCDFEVPRAWLQPHVDVTSQILRFVRLAGHSGALDLGRDRDEVSPRQQERLDAGTDPPPLPQLVARGTDPICLEASAVGTDAPARQVGTDAPARPGTKGAGVDAPPQEVLDAGTDPRPLRQLVARGLDAGTDPAPLPQPVARSTDPIRLETSAVGTDAPARQVGTDAPARPGTKGAGVDAPLQVAMRDAGVDAEPLPAVERGSGTCVCLGVHLC